MLDVTERMPEENIKAGNITGEVKISSAQVKGEEQEGKEEATMRIHDKGSVRS
jgi:hypothetical protein